ncbi:MAG TPA: type I phosphomannose isomerase catalytic subunit, partial [Urbifossiella sp.]
SCSRVANGWLGGATLRDLLATETERILGSARLINGRFPLLLKFIDARQELSVQVHPNDEQAGKKCPGANGKTEAWVVLDANPATSRIYAGFQPGITADHFRDALKNNTTPATLHSFTPVPGDCVFLEAGMVHAIGADILLFEVQQTSDITYRLYDWDRVDGKTGVPRELHVEDGLAVTNFAGSAVCKRAGASSGRERLVDCDYFTLDRITNDRRFTVGTPGRCRMIIVLEAAGRTEIEWNSGRDDVSPGNVLLIPAEIGECSILPAGMITLLECGIPAP